MGGLPRPVGGVTGFIHRLASNNMVGILVDLYPTGKKIIPSEFKGKFVQLHGFFSFFIFYNTSSIFSGKKIFFNFSTTKSLFLILMLRKRSNLFFLTLHHGELQAGVFSRFIFRALSKKLDRVYAITPYQKIFFESIGVDESRIVLKSTYLPPALESCPGKISSPKNFPHRKTIFIASGYPSSLYNHDWCIRSVGGKNNAFLFLYLYGEGDKKKEYSNMELPDNVVIKWDYSSSEFINALSLADYYLRPTSKDSFGIAVADAICVGAISVASNVCKRYPGTVIFNNGNYREFESIIRSALSGDDVRKIYNVEDTVDFSTFSFD